MTERYINRGTSFLFEVSAQLEAFDLDNFRRLYHQSELFSKYSFAYSRAPLDKCVDQGVDDFSCIRHETEQCSELRIVFFGQPNDELIHPQNGLTHTATETLRRIACYRKYFCEQWLLGSPPLAPEWYSLTRVDFEMFIGRRRLGAERYEAFCEALESHHENVHGIRLSLKSKPTRVSRLGMYGRQGPTSADCLVDGDIVCVHSFDRILDDARLLALEPFPFPDQDLLRAIILETDNPSVVGMALERLEPIPENNDVFSAYLGSQNSHIHREAVLGTTDIRILRALLSAESESDKDLVRARIAILEQDEDTLLEVALNARWFDAEFAAIEALNDKEKLAQIVKRHEGESTPRANIVRTLAAAREAFIDHDAATLDLLLKDAHFDATHPILRMKAKLESRAKTPPKVFISYRHESNDHQVWVMNLAKDLRARGINALLDQWEVDLGDSLSDYMALQIAESDVMLFIITNASVSAVEAQDGGGIKFEFQIANARRYQGTDFRIIGVLRSGDRPPKHISDNLYVDFRNDAEYESALKRLVDSLLGRRMPPPVEQAYD